MGVGQEEVPVGVLWEEHKINGEKAILLEKRQFGMPGNSFMEVRETITSRV